MVVTTSSSSSLASGEDDNHKNMMTTTHHNMLHWTPRKTLPNKLTIMVLLLGVTGMLVQTSMMEPRTVVMANFKTETTFPSSSSLSSLSSGVPCHSKNDTDGHRKDDASVGYFRPDKIFGHLHYAKTAGTDVNGQLAARYERVCGHKGYSYDAFQFNKRLEEKAETRRNATLRLGDAGPDIFSANYKNHNRGRVPLSIMREIGYEDCDYVSLEADWMHWREVAKVWPLELHVPCREPLEHLMSQCNFIHRRFDCQATDLAKEIRQCFVHPNRFHSKLTKMENVTLKCFTAAAVEPYLEYMDQFLQRKRLPSTYVHRATNDHRNREQECIWKNQTLADNVLEILLSHDYYRWCNQCIGSDNDLLRQER